MNASPADCDHAVGGSILRIRWSTSNGVTPIGVIFYLLLLLSLILNPKQKAL